MIVTNSSKTTRPILFLALDDVLCLCTPYGLSEVLEIMRQHKRVNDRGLIRRSPSLWNTLFEVNVSCRLEAIHMEFAPRYVLRTDWTRLLDRDAMNRVLKTGGLAFVADNLHPDWETIKIPGATPAQEIQDWLQAHGNHTRSWAVLDSTRSGTGLNGDCPYTVLCQAGVGFTMADQDKLRQALQSRVAAPKDASPPDCCVPGIPSGCLTQPVLSHR